MKNKKFYFIASFLIAFSFFAAFNAKTVFATCNVYNPCTTCGDYHGCAYSGCKSNPCSGKSSYSFGRVTQPIVASQLQAFSTGINTIVSSINVSNLTTDDSKGGLVSLFNNFGIAGGLSLKAVDGLVNLSGVTASNIITPVKLIQSALGINPTGTFSSAEVTSLKNFASQVNTAVSTLPAGVNEFGFTGADGRVFKFDTANAVFSSSDPFNPGPALRATCVHFSGDLYTVYGVCCATSAQCKAHGAL